MSGTILPRETLIRVLALCGLALPSMAAAAAAPQDEAGVEEAAVRASVKRMAAALMGEDSKAITSQLWTDSDLEREAAETWAASMTGQFRLRRLVYDKFGPEGLWDYDPRSRGNMPPGTKPGEVATRVEKVMPGAQVKVEGDHAKVTFTADPKRPMELKKVGSEWKPIYSSINPPKMSEPLLRNFIRANGYWGPNHHKTADELEAGKYKSGAEVRKALDRRQDDSAAEIAVPIQLPRVPDAPAARRVNAKPLTQAQYDVRTAAMLPELAVSDYDVERAPLGEERKKAMLEASAKLKSELAELVKRADEHPDQSAVIVKEITAKKRAAGLQIGQALTPDDQAKLDQTSHIIIYEAAIVRRLRTIRPGGPEGIERHLKAAAATDEQRATIAKIRDDLAKRQDEIFGRESAEISGLTGTFKMDLWQQEAESETRDAIRSVRKVFTPQQLAKWDASLVSARAQPARPAQPGTAQPPTPQRKTEPLPF